MIRLKVPKMTNFGFKKVIFGKIYSISFIYGIKIRYNSTLLKPASYKAICETFKKTEIIRILKPLNVENCALF